MTTAVETDTNLLPVPGAECLRWAGEPLGFAPRPRCNTLPVVVATGGADAALLHLGRGDRGEVLLSRRLDGAFDRWPPTPGEPVEQMTRDFGNTPPRVVAWPDGRFVVGTHGGFVGRWDAPSPTQDHRVHGHGTRDGGIYVYTQRDGASVLEHRAGDALDQVTLVGPMPAPHRSPFAGVTPGGVLWLAVVDRAPPRDLPIDLTVDMVRAVPGELRACGSFTCPAGFYPDRVLGRADGGAWVVMQGRDGVRVQGVDAAGGPHGEPWQMPLAQRFRGEPVFAPWRDGFAVFLLMNPVTLLLSDGVHTTRVQGALGGAQVLNRYPSIAVSPAGTSILVAHQTIEGFQIGRAEVSSAGSGEGGREAVDPWADDRRVLEQRAARAAERAANPPPPRLPGRPVEGLDDDAPYLHSCSRFLGQIYLRAMLRAITFGPHDVGGGLRGTPASGEYLEPDGSGNHVAFAWGPEGLVGIAFDHDMNEEAGIDHDLLNPERHFRRVPDTIAPLVRRAIALANREVTGALWITAGPEGRWDDVGHGTERLQPFALRAADVLSTPHMGHTWPEFVGATEAQGRLAAVLAASAVRGERHEITPEEEATLLAGSAGNEGVPPAADLVARRAAVLRRLGIEWRGAVKRAEAVAQEDADHGYALLDAVAREDVGAVRGLIERGANVGKKSRPGQLGRRWSMGGATPLIVAIHGKNVELTTMLLDAGASATPEALNAAASVGSRRLCELLLERGADMEPVKGNVFYAAISGRDPDAVALFIDLGAETGMSAHWWDQFESIAKSCNRPDLLERIPEPAHIKAYRARQLPDARQNVRKFIGDALNHARLRHVVLAMRGIHEAMPGTSVFEGTPAEGRHAWSSGGGASEVLAWNEHGMVGWACTGALRPGEASAGSDMRQDDETFSGAPAPLRELARRAVTWAPSNSPVVEAFWIFPEADDIAGLRGWKVQHPSAFEAHGAYGTHAADTRTPGWPRDALALRQALATQAFCMSRLAARAEYPTVTATDEALMLEAPKGRRKARPRREGIAAAVEMLGQIGIRWSPPSERI